MSTTPVLSCGVLPIYLTLPVCVRWEEEPREEGVKWRTLEHKGPVFADAYQRLPSSVKFYYNGRAMALSDTAEEVAGFYARMLEHEYTTREMFNTNFMKDWRKVRLRKTLGSFGSCSNSERDACHYTTVLQLKPLPDDCHE